MKTINPNKITLFVAILLAAENCFATDSILPQTPLSPALEARNGLTCKQVFTCEEAVALWCGGYSRADRDNDGIPCENVCSSVEEVDEIRTRIGC